jgi:hypothetical protein
MRKNQPPIAQRAIAFSKAEAIWPNVVRSGQAKAKGTHSMNPYTYFAPALMAACGWGAGSHGQKLEGDDGRSRPEFNHEGRILTTDGEEKFILPSGGIVTRRPRHPYQNTGIDRIPRQRPLRIIQKQRRVPSV